MKRTISRVLQTALLVAVLALAGCAGNQQGYQQAFDSKSSLTQNQCSLSQSCDSIFKIVKQTFIQQGFTIESADTKSGIIKAVRNMQDKDDPEISYNIHASADVSEVTGAETNVSLAASQQTILHRATTTWWHLLWIFPVIPTGTEYQTLVVKEGNITEPAFYTDFFNALKVSVAKYDMAVKVAAAKAAEKAEAKAAEERAAKQKAEAAAKAAAAKVEAERVSAEKAAKAKAEAAAKVSAEKAAAEKAVADKKARIKAEADKVAAEIAEAEKLDAEKEFAALEAAKSAAPNSAKK